MRDEGAPGTEGDASQFKAFIGGLSYQISDQDLKTAFERFDAISAKVMIDRYTGRSRGFGFVFFKGEETLKEAIAQMHEKELDGRKISVVKAVPENQTSPGTPAAALGGGSGARRDNYPPRRDYGGRGGGGAYDRGYGGGYDRGYGGGYDRGADRGGYGADYRGAYADRGGYGAGYSYDRGADPYGRDAYARGYSGGYGGGYYDDRAAGGYGGGYGAAYAERGYDDRGAGGPDRRGYSASARPAPYASERPPVERPRYDAPPPRR